jgi:hypothetical protein
MEKEGTQKKAEEATIVIVRGHGDAPISVTVGTHPSWWRSWPVLAGLLAAGIAGIALVLGNPLQAKAIGEFIGAVLRWLAIGP